MWADRFVVGVAILQLADLYKFPKLTGAIASIKLTILVDDPSGRNEVFGPNGRAPSGGGAVDEVGPIILSTGRL